MATISATMVKELRERSGLPMMDCKKALMETGGDQAAAMELLRKRGAAAAEKKAGRAMGEGRIGSYVDPETGIGALVEVHCETAPVSKNPEFIAMTENVAKQAAVSGIEDIEKLSQEKFVDDPSKTVQDLLHDVLNRIRENMSIARAKIGKGVATYVHHNGKLGVMLEYEGSPSDPSVLNDICMHIAAMAPEAVSREEMPADVVKKEEDLARQQILDSGKPADLVDKILTGKMGRWFSERVLLEQPFVKDDKQKVGKVAEGAGVKVKGYTRMTVTS